MVRTSFLKGSYDVPSGLVLNREAPISAISSSFFLLPSWGMGNFLLENCTRNTVSLRRLRNNLFRDRIRLLFCPPLNIPLLKNNFILLTLRETKTNQHFCIISIYHFTSPKSTKNLLKAFYFSFCRLFRETREREEQRIKRTRERKKERIQYNGRNKKIGDNPIGERNIWRAGEAGSYLLKVSRQRFADGKKARWKTGPETKCVLRINGSAAGSCAATDTNALVPSLCPGVSIKLCPIFSSLRWGYVSLSSGCPTRIYLYQRFYDVLVRGNVFSLFKKKNKREER